MTDVLDLVIVGAGPAGLSAAIQARRDELSILLISDEDGGGLVRAAYRIDNLPGYPGGIIGNALADKLVDQARWFGVPFTKASVLRIEKNKDLFEISTDQGTHASRCVILATGTSPTTFDTPYPLELAKRIHRDARSFPKHLGKLDVAVVGGGEAALDAALVASFRGADVRVFARGYALKAPERLIEEAKQASIEIITGAVLDSIGEDDGKLELEFVLPESRMEVDVHHLMISIGRRPRSRLYKELTGSDKLPEDIHTNIPGLFAVGDLIRRIDRFAATAIGDGQRAARAVLKGLGKEKRS